MSESANTKLNPVMETYNRFPITLIEGKGSYVWDDQGKKFLDYTSGIATCNLGHVPEAVKEAMDNQLEKLWHCSNLYHIPAQQQLAEQLVSNSCADQVFFCNSGTEANEAVIKMARRYAQKIKETDAFEVVSFRSSFHGRTLAALAATGQEKIQEGFAPLTPGFRYLPYNDEKALDELVSEQTCAVLLELVQGEGGVIPAEKEWVQKVAELCKKHGLLLMVDEVQTGMGRTGTLFAYQQYGIEPDVISLAKGLGSGIPIGAVLAKQEAAKAFSPGTHGSTFGGNPLSATAGLATTRQLTETDILAKAGEASAYLIEKLEQLKEKSDQIVEIRGKGMLQGLVVTGNAIDFVAKAREHQVLILVAGPNVVRILPPLTTNQEEIDQFIHVMETVFASN